MPDVREPRVEGGAASLSTRIKPRDQPPLYPGMRCALKPEFIDMEHLRRQTTVSEKTHYRGLPHKHNLAVPMLRKWVVHQMGMIPRQKFAQMSSKAVSAKVSGLTHPASKWYQWLCLNIELEKAELVSLSTRHMGVMNRKNASAFKMEMDSAGFSASSMKSHCHEIGSYILDIIPLCVPPCDPLVAAEAEKAADLLIGCSGKYSSLAKKDSRQYKRADDLCENWLGTDYEHEQTFDVYNNCLSEALRLLGLYTFRDPSKSAIVNLQYPAAQLRTIQQLLMTCFSIAMMAPREAVVASFKLSWVDETGGGAVTVNPGRDAHDFKNLNWKGGAVPIRKELLTALEEYTQLTWPATAEHFEGSGNLRGGMLGGQQFAAKLLGASNRAELRVKGLAAPVFFDGVPDEMDAVALSDKPDTEKLAEVSKLLGARLDKLQLSRGSIRDALKYCYVDWLGTYQKYDHNTARHMAAWTAYVEWFEQLEHDAQGLPNRFIGMQYAEHVQIAADIMNHTVQVHEESYLPVSPSKQTRAQLDAQAAGAVPLGGSATGSPGSAAGQQATQPSPASGSTATASVPQQQPDFAVFAEPIRIAGPARNVRRRIDPPGSTATPSSSAAAEEHDSDFV